MTIPDEAVQLDTHATAARLNRLLTVCHGLRWTDVGVLALDNESTKKALGDLSEILFMDGIDEAVSGKSTADALPFLQGVKVDARQELDRFAEAAKNWGWQEDQGYNEGVIEEAKAEFDASYSVLEQLLSAVEPDSSPRAQALEEALRNLLHAVCGETGFANAVRQVSRLPWPWPSLDIAEAAAIRALSSQPVADHIADAGKMVADGWLPIVEAKRDGTEYYTWNGRKQHVARFDKVDNEWVSTFQTVTKRIPLSPQPTHCRALPASPGASE